jgi:hypothetical protein
MAKRPGPARPASHPGLRLADLPCQRPGPDPGAGRRHLLPARRDPEPFDADRDATLAREAFEENTVRIAATTAYLGYQEVRQPGRPAIAQVRMAGIIAEFAPRAPDPDNGRLNRRYMTSLAAAPGVLGWGQPAEAQARAAAAAGRSWGLPVGNPAPDGYQD